MTSSTSAVAACCWRASPSSWVSRAIFFLSEAETADLGVARGLGAARAAGRCDRAAALEPRLLVRLVIPTRPVAERRFRRRPATSYTPQATASVTPSEASLAVGLVPVASAAAASVSPHSRRERLNPNISPVRSMTGASRRRARRGRSPHRDRPAPGIVRPAGLETGRCRWLGIARRRPPVPGTAPCADSRPAASRSGR